MAKKKKTNPKDSNIGSSSLLPARPVGEKPDMAYFVKTEPEDYEYSAMEIDSYNNPEIADLFEGITDARNRTVLNEGADSNHSITSTCTELMDNGEGSNLLSPSENHVVQPSFSQVLVKHEMGVPSYQEECFTPSPAAANQSNVEESLSSNDLQNFSKSNLVTPCISDQIQKESSVNNANYQAISDQNITDAPVSSNTEPENHVTAELESVNLPQSVEEIESVAEIDSEKLSKKRSLDAQVELLRSIKKVKREPCEDDGNETGEQNTDTHLESTPVEVIDADIAVLTLPEKNIEMITLSDDEEPQILEQEIESDIEEISVSLTNCNIPNINSNIPVQPSRESPKKLAKDRSFSIDILSYFSVTGELDRYDCRASLDYLQKKKVNNPLNIFFPVVKRESKSEDHIQKGDFLFKEIAEKHSNTKEVPISQGAPQDLPVQPMPQSVTGIFPVPSVPQATHFSSNLLSAETCTNESKASISENIDYNIPKKLHIQSSVNFSGLPVSQSAMYLPNLFPTPTSSNFKLNPSQLDDLLNSLKRKIPGLSKEEAASDQHPIRNNNQIAHNPVISPQVSSATALSANHTFQMPSYPATTTFTGGVSSSVPKTSCLPAVPCSSTVSSCSQETHDSSHAVSNTTLLPSSTIEKSIQNRNTNVIRPQVPFQPVTTLPNNKFQSLPGHGASVNPLRPAASTSSVGTRDPRIAPNGANREIFPPRKGEKDLNLYYNVGEDNITQSLDYLILQWNPEWMPIQQETRMLPPIKLRPYKPVVYFYKNETEYYNTYVPLHLLHIWYNIFQSWVDEKFTVVPNCKVQSVKTWDKYFRLSFSAVLRNMDACPKNDDIVWCMHNKKQAFLRLDDVKKKPVESGVKLRMTLLTLHNFNFKLGDEVSLTILWNTRSAFLQTEALTSIDSSIKDLILNPDRFLHEIEFVQLNNNRKIKEQRDDILRVVMQPKIRVIVIETYYAHDNVLLLTQVAFNILLNLNSLFREKFNLTTKSQATIKKQSKVLIVLKNDQLLEKLYKSLSQYEPILAVRTKQINLPPGLIKFTIEDLVEKKEYVIRTIQEHHIFLTTVSSFGSTEKNLLSSKVKDLICIIDDAHLCTEVETALPLTLNISKLLLIGNKNRSPDLPSMLIDQKYHVSLIMRIFKAKKS